MAHCLTSVSQELDSCAKGKGQGRCFFMENYLTSVTSTSGQTGSTFSFKKGKSQELDFCAKWKGQGRSFFMAHCLTSLTSTSGQTGSSFSFKKGKSQELDSCAKWIGQGRSFFVAHWLTLVKPEVASHSKRVRVRNLRLFCQRERLRRVFLRGKLFDLCDLYSRSNRKQLLI